MNNKILVLFFFVLTLSTNAFGECIIREIYEKTGVEKAFAKELGANSVSIIKIKKDLYNVSPLELLYYPPFLHRKVTFSVKKGASEVTYKSCPAIFHRDEQILKVYECEELGDFEVNVSKVKKC